MQDMWETYVSDTHECCPASFWRLYSSVQHQSVTCQNVVLQTVKKTFHVERQRKERWPTNNRHRVVARAYML